MKLTKAQRRVLTWLRKNKDSGDGAIVCNGLECWYGLERTNWTLVNGLLQLLLVSPDRFGGGCKRYEINSSGERALDGLPPYRDCDGNYHETFVELVAADERLRGNGRAASQPSKQSRARAARAVAGAEILLGRRRR